MSTSSPNILQKTIYGGCELASTNSIIYYECLVKRMWIWCRLNSMKIIDFNTILTFPSQATVSNSSQYAPYIHLKISSIKLLTWLCGRDKYFSGKKADIFLYCFFNSLTSESSHKHGFLWCRLYALNPLRLTFHVTFSVYMYKFACMATFHHSIFSINCVIYETKITLSSEMVHYNFQLNMIKTKHNPPP